MSAGKMTEAKYQVRSVQLWLQSPVRGTIQAPLFGMRIRNAHVDTKARWFNDGYVQVTDGTELMKQYETVRSLIKKLDPDAAAFDQYKALTKAANAAKKIYKMPTVLAINGVNLAQHVLAQIEAGNIDVDGDSWTPRSGYVLFQ